MLLRHLEALLMLDESELYKNFFLTVPTCLKGVYSIQPRGLLSPKPQKVSFNDVKITKKAIRA